MTGKLPGAPGEEKGWEDLSHLDPLEVCRKSLATYDQESREYTLRFLNVDFAVTLEKRTVMPLSERNALVPDLGLDFRIMILDYLANCSEVPLSGRLVSGAQLKGGEFFFRGTHGLELDPLINMFGNNPEQFKKVGISVGGKGLELGDVSLQLPVLPKVPIAYVLWAADDEFSGRLSVLFDSTADRILHLDTLRTAVTATNKFLLVARPQ
jgi:hypothetical protein